jgi:hypothetical protein
MQKISSIKKYFKKVLGLDIQMDLLGRKDLQDLPLYIRDSYKIYKAILFENSMLLLEPNEKEGYRISLIHANMDVVRKRLGYPVVVLLNTCNALQRSRLIEKRISFIVPGTQLYLPEMLVDLREVYPVKAKEINGQLLRPSAQFLLIFHLLHSVTRYELAEYNYKSIAVLTGYSPMAITLAAANLNNLGLIDIIGTKDKSMSFRYDKKELWEKSLSGGLVRNPVKEKVYVDNLPTDLQLLKCNVAALSDYSDISPGNQQYYAIEKTDFKNLVKRDTFENVNIDEGKICLEIWKYSPGRIWGDILHFHNSVDPLSLYISLQDSADERIEMALEQIIREFQW